MPDMGKKISYLVPKTAQMPAVAVNQVVIQTWHFNLFTNQNIDTAPEDDLGFNLGIAPGQRSL